MELKQLEAFAAVVDCSSFSQAAKKLYLTQPTVSAHVASLEKELHTRLIVRTTKQIQVTTEGHQLYDYAVAMLALRSRILEEFAGSHKRIIELGASTIPSAYILPEVLSAFGQLNQNVYFHSKLSDSMGIIRQIQDRRLDFGFVGTAIEDNGLVFIPFLEDELVAVTPVTPHYLQLKKEKASFRQLLREPLILREKGSGTKKAIDRYFEQNKIPVNALHVVARMNDLEAVKKSIINGLGISILSSKSVQDLKQSRQVILFPLDDPAPKRRLYIVYRRDAVLPSHVRQFIEFVQSYYHSAIAVIPSMINANAGADAFSDSWK